MKAWWRRFRDLGLTAQIVGVTLALLLVIQAVVFVMVRFTIADKAMTQISQELEVGERVWRRLLEQNADRLRQGAELLASDLSFRSAIVSADQGTVASALDSHGQRIGARLSALFDADWRLVAHSEHAQAVSDDDLRQIGMLLGKNPIGSQLAFVGQHPYQFVVAPVHAPLQVGWVVMGFPVDQSLAEDMFQLFSVHLAVFASAPGQPAGLVVSTLPLGQADALVTAPPGPSKPVLGGDGYVARRFALQASQGRVDTVLLRSYAEVVAPFVRLQWVLGGITLLGIVLFGLASWTATRRVTQPLRALLDVTQALEQGQYDVKVLGTRRGDEVGRLARGFDAMRKSIAAQQAEIRHLAFWDRLTGLPNREQFRAALLDAIAAQGATGQPVSVVALNLDRFKHVNEVLGYGLGDALLRAVAERLRHQAGDSGLTARLGGDEFALLLPGADAAQALLAADRIAKALEQPLAMEQQTVDLGASMGVACWPHDAQDVDTLLSRADIAMRAAKAKTAGVLHYSPALDSSSAQSLSLLTDLRQALERDQLRLYVQPKVDVGSGRVVALEGLVRWEHPVRGMVPPMQFIPFAEQTGFVRHLTLWMFEETCRQWPTLQAAVPGLRMAINLSTRDLMDQEFAARVSALLQAHGVMPQLFCLEITESAIMDDPQRAEATLNKLAAMGFKLSIDDFGTGYSSLAYLKRLPVSELKIDKSFVMGMSNDSNDAKIVRSTVDLAHNLGLSVVAEGVEDQAILSALRELQCDEAQGYYISRPMPAQAFAGWCESWHVREN